MLLAVLWLQEKPFFWLHKNASTRQTNRQGKRECGRGKGRQRTSDWYTPFTLAPKTPVSILLSVPKHISCGFYQCAAHPIDTDTWLQLQQNDDEFGFPLVQYEAKLKLIFEKREKRKRIIAAKTRQHMAEPSNPSHMVRSPDNSRQRVSWKSFSGVGHTVGLGLLVHQSGGTDLSWSRLFCLGCDK